MKGRLMFALVISAFILVVSLFLVIAGDEMTVEANIIASRQIVSVEVPDYFFFGDVNVGEESNKTKVVVNNTGNVDVVITPRLVNSDDIFSNLYFQRRVADSWKKIGDFSMNITKPTTSGSVESEYCYMKLDLTDYDNVLSGDLNGHNAKIKFYAVAQ